MAKFICLLVIYGTSIPSIISDWITTLFVTHISITIYNEREVVRHFNPWTSMKWLCCPFKYNSHSCWLSLFRSLQLSFIFCIQRLSTRLISLCHVYYIISLPMTTYLHIQYFWSKWSTDQSCDGCDLVKLGETRNFDFVVDYVFLPAFWFR